MDNAFLPHHLNLVHELENAGFSKSLEADVPTFVGDITDQGDSWGVVITMDGYYPARPPTVRLADSRLPQGWHENRDRSMCLYPTAVTGTFPWFVRGNLLERVRTWCRQKEDGWPADQPDLDLHRYWRQSRQYRLVVHGPLPQGCHGTRRFGLVAQTRTLSERGQQAPPRRRPTSHRYRYAAVRDIGELSQPVTEWRQLRDLITDADDVEAMLRNGRAQLLMIRYTRMSHVGVLALDATTDRSGLALSAIEAAEDSAETRNLRRGSHLTELLGKSVAIIGVGAIGSHLALSLHRAGVGTLSLHDYDILRPGNLARHAADPSYVGWNKAEAVARTIRSGDQTVQWTDEIISSLDRARTLVSEHDLVVDASADETVVNLLAIAADEAGKTIVSTYLSNQGRSKVVEVIAGPASSWAATTEMDPLGVDGYEAGCGDPVSPTPLYEVLGVVSMGARSITDLLRGKNTDTQVCERS